MDQLTQMELLQMKDLLGMEDLAFFTKIRLCKRRRFWSIRRGHYCFVCSFKK